MIGKYKGSYIYSNERIQQSLSRDKTIFNIDITEFDGVNFVGTVNEEPCGQPGTGSIHGKIENNTISFIKQMQIAASITPEGKVKTYNSRHPKIYYEGKLVEDVYSGTWKIKFGFIFVGILPIPIPPTSGKWEMGKV